MSGCAILENPKPEREYGPFLPSKSKDPGFEEFSRNFKDLLEYDASKNDVIELPKEYVYDQTVLIYLTIDSNGKIIDVKPRGEYPDKVFNATKSFVLGLGRKHSVREEWGCEGIKSKARLLAPNKE